MDPKIWQIHLYTTKYCVINRYICLFCFFIFCLVLFFFAFFWLCIYPTKLSSNTSMIIWLKKEMALSLNFGLIIIIIIVNSSTVTIIIIIRNLIFLFSGILFRTPPLHAWAPEWNVQGGCVLLVQDAGRGAHIPGYPYYLHLCNVLHGALEPALLSFPHSYPDYYSGVHCRYFIR